MEEVKEHHEIATSLNIRNKTSMRKYLFIWCAELKFQYVMCLCVCVSMLGVVGLVLYLPI